MMGTRSPGLGSRRRQKNCRAFTLESDISAPSQRYAIIKRNEECGVCQKKILYASGDYRMAGAYTSVGSMEPFYVFPCGHSFHSHCLIAHVTKSTTETQAEYIQDL
ncbi:vacuolar sorting protein 18-like [Primulina tabacum]|uniref:vacuolar sorting protein 18-like n=1 Tax=Primulina tabacum TaxID=48773 RepID=UPI003F5AD084